VIDVTYRALAFGQGAPTLLAIDLGL